MFSGKTTALLSKIDTASLAGHHCVIVKHKKDVRYGETDKEIRTHNSNYSNPITIGGSVQKTGNGRATPRIVTVERLSEVTLKTEETVVGVDEGQFYPDLPEICDKWASDGKWVIVAALDGDFQRKPFGRVAELIPLAETVKKRKAVCMVCSKAPASFTKRIVASDKIIVVGGQELYRAVCRSCFGN